MLKFLTHKLRTHSINEDQDHKEEERDSGTESDTDHDLGEICSDVIMKWNDVTDISMKVDAWCACTDATTPTPSEPLYDHHSSEEELEVINSGGGAGCRRRASSPPLSPLTHGKRRTHRHHTHHTHQVETPVRFRTSPPRSAVRPPLCGVRAPPAPRAPRRAPLPPRTSPASPLPGPGSGPGPLHSSPRRHASRRHRPALDFDKMQQWRMSSGGGVRAWRAGGTAGGELSVFCW